MVSQVAARAGAERMLVTGGMGFIGQHAAGDQRPLDPRSGLAHHGTVPAESTNARVGPDASSFAILTITSAPSCTV